MVCPAKEYFDMPQKTEGAGRLYKAAFVVYKMIVCRYHLTFVFLPFASLLPPPAPAPMLAGIFLLWSTQIAHCLEFSGSGGGSV